MYGFIFDIHATHEITIAQIQWMFNKVVSWLRDSTSWLPLEAEEGSRNLGPTILPTHINISIHSVCTIQDNFRTLDCISQNSVENLTFRGLLPSLAMNRSVVLGELEDHHEDGGSRA